MSFLDGLKAIAPLVLAPTPLAPLSAASVAQNLIGELGHRILSWVDQLASSGGLGSAAWVRETGGQSTFKPDVAELSRGGDVYGIRDIASQISAQHGGTPTQEGELRRALEDFTRAAVVQVGGLSGADGNRQVAGISEALASAGAFDGGEGMDGIVSRIEAGTRSLTAANG